MIRSFKCKETKALYDGERTRRWQDVRKVAIRKLDMLHHAKALTDLRQFPGNRLEALKGGREGQHSIRINDQWRICFRWTEEPEDVEIVDYH
jgi:proteic killer suppression protein